MIRAKAVLRRRPQSRGDHARALGGAFFIVMAIVPATAHADCVAMAPGFDGVLRLDTGRAFAVPCTRPPRVYAAAPSGRSAAPAPPAESTTPKSEPQATATVPASPTTDDLARLKEQTARLQEELARLNGETAGLRAETRRLHELLARREPNDAEAVNRRGADKLDSRLGPAKPEATAPKGDLLKPSSPKDETRAAPSTGPAEAGKGASDQTEFERRKGVAERAWSELLDFAARLKKDLSGKPE